MSEQRLNALVSDRLLDVINQHLSGVAFKSVCEVISGDEWHSLLALLIQDLHAYEKKDPASAGKFELLVNTSSSYLAVALYRLAHMLITHPTNSERFTEIAFKLTEISRRQFAIDIHPAAKIGHSLVLDHAHGITIGETVIIGDDCYILGGTIIGSRGIANNTNSKCGRRHPKIGSHVEIGAYCRILGALTIGDHVIISPHAVLTSDIANDSSVSITNQIQIVKRNSSGSVSNQLSSYVDANNKLIILTKDIVITHCYLADSSNIHLAHTECVFSSTRNGIVQVEINMTEKFQLPKETVSLSLMVEGFSYPEGSKIELMLLNIPGLRSLLENKKSEFEGDNWYAIS
ncbi:serine O-acetyltransferase [Photobacterium minamisatsumaniensis]|uniref:serine O-acetyltransferase n=1 Tax=Photobacterium minamisatsumaniensis TaxID=2910233 RepID=UPI003D0B532E